jgi:hypothetical protein
MTTDKARLRAGCGALLLAAAGLLAGCGGMSKSDCEKADWRELGRQDAERGQAASRFTQRAESCSKAGVGNADHFEYSAGHAQGQLAYCTPDRGRDEALAGQPRSAVCQTPPAAKAYRTGYDDGLQRFCTARNGFDFGRVGAAYRDTCPPESVAAFQGGYRLGKELHELNRRLERIASEQADQRKVLADAKAQATARENASRRLGQLDGDEAAVRRLIRQAERDGMAVSQPSAPVPLTRARVAELLVGTWQLSAVRFDEPVDLNRDGVKSVDAMSEYSACARDARLEIGADQKSTLRHGTNTAGCKTSSRTYDWSVVDAKVRKARHDKGRRIVDERAVLALQLRGGAPYNESMVIESIGADALTVRTDLPDGGDSGSEATVTYTRVR